MHPVIQIQGTNGDAMPTLFMLIWIALGYAVIEFAFLHRILTRGDFDTLTKLLWVVLVIGAPVLGCALYVVAAPDAPRTPDAVRPARRGDDLSGTPWANDPGYTRPS